MHINRSPIRWIRGAMWMALGPGLVMSAPAETIAHAPRSRDASLQAAAAPLTAPRGAGPGVRIDADLAAIARGDRTPLLLSLPDGTRAQFAFRSATEAGGAWTWIGESVRGERATISFGPGAAFGRIEREGRAPLQIESTPDGVWLREAVGRGVVDGNLHPASPLDDARVPPRLPLGTEGRLGTVPLQPKGGPATVDVVVGMSAGFVSAQGGLAAAQVRVAQLVALANTALERGLVEHRLRLAHSLEVNYSDLLSNDRALEDVTGVSCNPTCAPAAVPAGLLPLRAARETHGGDLVVLLRPLRAPQHGGCGLAWLLGSGGFAIDATDAPFAYSVASLGNDVDEGDGRTYACGDATFAHEVGHNLGQAHNPQDASAPGTHTYAYGYREAGSTGFHTVMAYRLPNSSQFGIDYFGNPAVTYASTGRPTGSATANNGRSLQLSMPLVAQFRAEIPTGPAIFSNGFETP